MVINNIWHYRYTHVYIRMYIKQFLTGTLQCMHEMDNGYGENPLLLISNGVVVLRH